MSIALGSFGICIAELAIAGRQWEDKAIKEEKEIKRAIAQEKYKLLAYCTKLKTGNLASPRKVVFAYDRKEGL